MAKVFQSECMFATHEEWMIACKEGGMLKSVMETLIALQSRATTMIEDASLKACEAGCSFADAVSHTGLAPSFCQVCGH